MPFITTSDMHSHIYPESIEAISRGDEDKLTTAINAALREATPFLSRYNVPNIWAATEAEKTGIFADLVMAIKDIAKWHFVAVNNAAVDLELAQVRYEGALKALKRIQQAVQTDWPLADAEDSEKLFRAGSRTKFDHWGFTPIVDPDDPFS